MYAQQYFLHPINIIVSILFLSLIPRNHSHEDYAKYNQECNSTISAPCGKLNPHYPFTGHNIRPWYCGIQEFELSCEGSRLSTFIGPLSKYYVIDVKLETNKLELELERSTHLVDDICAIDNNIGNTILNHDTLFEYGDDTEEFYFFYNCSQEIHEKEIATKFTCPDTNQLVLFEVSSKAQDDKLHLCEHIKVPLKKMEPWNWGSSENVPRQLKELSQRSFKVHFLVDQKACLHCMRKDLLCWRDTYLTRNNTCPHKNSVQSPDEGKRKTLVLILSAVTGALGGSMLLLLLVFFVSYRRKRAKHGSPVVSQNVSSHSFSISDSEKRGGKNRVPIFSYNELEKATNNFDSSNELGDGGFGAVYKGKLQDGREVAVKRLYENNFKRVELFMNEVAILEPLRHPNLVVLYGSTSPTCRKLLLVYEYIPNGTIADHLYGEDAKPGSLPWKTRMSIAVETASALSYLHVKEVIHRDVKTTNILLDNNFCIKVADFGLSRLFPTNVTHVSTAPQGTPGYVDPEYRQCYQLTNKSDVYSFGVVLIELISSMPAVDISRHRHEINLSDMAINKIQGNALHELVDPTLGFNSDYKVQNMITEVAELAFLCLQNEREMRPSMEEVHKVLKETQSKYYV